METRTIDALLYKKMIVAGAANLKNHVSEINDLNVFPIPDGDTGDNMLMTVLGGAETEEEQTLGQTSRRIADGMLLSARGNSGVILSQCFDGIADGLDGLDCADILRFGKEQNGIFQFLLPLRGRQPNSRVRETPRRVRDISMSF